MLKFAALLFNTLVLLIYQFFFTDGITVTQKVPASAKVESEFTVELTIKKGDAIGFAKLQQDLPDGFTASEGNAGSASFTFSNQSVKFIWMSMPNDKEFKVSYKIKVATGIITGEKFLAGKFAYVVDNVKQTVDIPSATINIIANIPSAPPVAANNPTPPAKDNAVTTISGKIVDNTGASFANTSVLIKNAKGEIIKSVMTDENGEFTSDNMAPSEDYIVTLEEKDTKLAGKKSFAELKNKSGLVVKTTSLGSAEELVAAKPPANPPASNADFTGISCVRNAPANGANEFNVDVTISKGNLIGFAKFIDVLPAGFSAAAIESKGASFTFSDQKVKFVWVSLPPGNEIKLSYKVTAAAGANGNQIIDGVFSYIENDETKKFVVPTSTISFGGAAPEPVASNPPPVVEKEVTPPPPAPEPVVTKTEPVVAKVEPPKPEVKTEPAPAATATTNKSISATNIPSPSGIVSYAVQIAALHNARTPEALAAMYKINENVNTEMADGFTKYTVGSHKEYKAARDAREEIKTKGVPGPWVTSYNKGKRITVQEALMISSQKWYK